MIEGNWQIEAMDVLDWAAEYDGPKFHALLCDPPYELGFMGKDWDRSGIAFKPDTWAALAEHLHPGAFGMAFASARGWHRLAVAIEDAKLRIHPSIFGWTYGSGFPKASRVKGAPAFESHRYGLQAMKPALEPIIVFQKPCRGKPVESITTTGAGTLWVEGGRIAANDHPGVHKYEGDCFSPVLKGKQKGKLSETTPRAGRWPANFCLIHHPGCQKVGTRRVKNTSGKASGPTSSKKMGYNTIGDFTRERGDVPYYADPDGLETIAAWECVPDCPVRKLGEQSGERPSGGKSGPGNVAIWGGVDRRQGGNMEKSTGTAACFFHQSDWSYEIAERLAQADPVLYQAKASRKERDAGLEVESRAMGAYEFRYRESGKGQFEGPTNVSRRNPHPTVKPIALARWLATLLLPPPEYAPRRILIPFSGSGSEGIGAGLAGWDEITMIDNEAEYCQIAEARMAHWLNQPEQLTLL